VPGAFANPNATSTTPFNGTNLTGLQVDSNGTSVSFYGLLASLHNFAIVLMAIGIVVAGLFWMGGRPQLAIGVLGGSVVLFGAPAFVGLVSNSFTGAVNVDIATGADTNSIEYQVAYVIVRIQNTVRGVSVILCALYGTLLGVDALLGGMDSARLNAFIIGVIMVIGSPFLVQVFSSVLNG
jgi:type IV secretory pathway VirB2 component (pilin)